MKVFALLLLFTSTAFAGSFTKMDSGYVSWDMEVRSKIGHLTITRSSVESDSNNLTQSEQKLVWSNLFSFPNLGTVANENIAFKDADDRSQETVNHFVQSKLMDEVSRLKVDVTGSEVSFQNVKCVEKGFFNKKLFCDASFTSKMEVVFR